jgi:hypothetical protein
MSTHQKIGWNTHPEDYCAEAKDRATKALHSEHSEGLTTLEKSYYHALKHGQVKNVTRPES